ncbi:hypothetical protein HDU98_004917, partial [Podochytrium sp. JEL0797]
TLPALMLKNNIKLVVLDSIAATLRYGFTEDEGSGHQRATMSHNERNDMVMLLAQALKKVAIQFDAVVLCVNQ